MRANGKFGYFLLSLFGYVVGGMSIGLIRESYVFALDLTAPFSLESAQVLPSGVRDPRFINIFMSADSKFNGGGGVEPLGNPLHQTVFWNDVIKLQQSVVDKGAIRSTLGSAGLDSNGTPGTTTGQVNTTFNVKVPALAIGLSDRFTLALAVPIMTVSVSADTGFVKSQDGQLFMKQLCSLSVDQCNRAAQRLNNSVNEKLVSLGYQPIQSSNFTNIGDVQLVGKYQVHKDPDNLLTVKTTFVLPTGTPPNADAALDVPTGDGRFELGGTLVYDRSLPKDFKWNAYGGVLALLPNNMDRRIPIQIGDPLSDAKENLTRDLGASFAMGTSLSHVFPSLGIITGVGYNFQFMTRPTYSGGALAPERYSFLSDLTPSEALHSATLMAGFSTVEWFQQKKFFYPLQANLVYSHPVLGRNVTTNDVVSGEVVLFF